MKKAYSILAILLAIIFIMNCNMKKNHEHGSSKESDAKLSGKITDGFRAVSVEARQFAFEPETIVVKKGEPVRLKVTSSDVKHGIKIDAFNINRELPPHEEQVIEFTPQKIGDFHFHCSVYCGSGHGKMHGTLKVIE